MRHTKMIETWDYIEKKKEVLRSHFEKYALEREKWIEKNQYYYNFLYRFLNYFIEPYSNIVEIHPETGHFLKRIPYKKAWGIDFYSSHKDTFKKNNPTAEFIETDLDQISRVKIEEKIDYIYCVNTLNFLPDVQSFLAQIKELGNDETRYIFINYNYLWEPILKIAEFFKLKRKDLTTNWLSLLDIKNFFELTGYELIKEVRFVLMPIWIPGLSFLLNEIVGRIPIINRLSLVEAVIARKRPSTKPDMSVSIIVPCKNEKGNIEDGAKRIPSMGTHTEIIFVDDKSTDGTREKIEEIIKKYKNKDIKLVEGPGICKSEAVWKGFEHAKGDILMILDGDLTVAPEELPRFYEAIIKGIGEFINGSRLVYPMEKQAMRLLNIAGNKFFSLLFSFLLNTSIKDTLCGTKVLFRKDYYRLKKYIGTWGAKDKWGDYDLLFGASKLNLKIIDLPVHYLERKYGQTKMTGRLKNGLRMLRICIGAFIKSRLF